MKPLKMLRKIILLLLFIQVLVQASTAQKPDVQKLKQLVNEHPQQDTERVNRLEAYAVASRFNSPKETFLYANEALALARKLHYVSGEADALLTLSFYQRFRSRNDSALIYGKQAMILFSQLKDTIRLITILYNMAAIYSNSYNYPGAISADLTALKLSEIKQSQKWLTLVGSSLGYLYLDLEDDTKAEQYLSRAMHLAERANDRDGVAHCVDGLATLAMKYHRWDEAMRLYKLRKQINIEANDMRGLMGTQIDIADLNEKQGKYAEVFPLLYKTLEQMKTIDPGPSFVSYAQGVMAKAYLDVGKPDSAILHGLESLQTNQRFAMKSSSRDISQTLARAYAAKGNFKDAYHYQLLYAYYRDSLNNQEAIRKTTALQYSADLDKKQSQITLLTKNQELSQRQNRQQKLILFGTIAGLLSVGGLSIFLWRNNRQKLRANIELQQRQNELKTTQTQLIQSEKMASLGELTAGIAHEIQNPLNFVNNFSEVSFELADEMKKELQDGNKEDAIALANDIKQNLEKIVHHGKRADAIVKGMLQHSRSSSGLKEMTDINALADEYLRLSYHGLRAKDKSFNAEMETAWDNSLPNIEVVSQDVGRVILNLFTNAFYSVHEKNKNAKEGFVPMVSVSTKKTGAKVEIRIKDNGSGIPDAVIKKIYQPFFTTKPTGEGTGLGLSLSYDIVTKGHGGELNVETKEGEFAEFIITLPIVSVVNKPSDIFNKPQ
ncbi:MAG: tetratricopeptide repeat protein [Chitinophagaceae bacterium]|nr:tetratricopeptide repeat protein [Chitinophagaceae bacterium]